MRVKDENKAEAIFNATIELANEIGFADISISKIAKKANISPSTIYVYFDNKDDMLKQTYLHVKTDMVNAFAGVLDNKLSIKETFALFMHSLLDYLLANPSYFLFLEQFENSPFVSKMELNEEIGRLLAPYDAFFESLRAQGVLKNVDISLLMSYCYFPVYFMVKESISHNYEINHEIIERAIELSWDAIKA